MAKVPGQKARHAIITDTCRENRGDSGALNEAIGRIEDTYDDLLRGWEGVDGVRFHLVITVERPEERDDG